MAVKSKLELPGDSPETIAMLRRIAELEAAGNVLLNAVLGKGGVSVKQIQEAAAVVRKGK